MLRQLSAIFDTRALGYTSALVAAKVEPERIDEAAAIINAHPGVSHNYKRNHDYNLWYTVAVPPGESLDDHVDVLHRDSGALVTRKLPTLKLYKIGVKLDMTGQDRGRTRRRRCSRTRCRSARPTCPRPISATSNDSRSGSCKRTSRTSSVRSRRRPTVLGVDEHDVLDMLRSFKERKLMRRFAAVMNHRSAGFKANAMGVWAVPDEELDAIGPQMAGFAAVSHCYRRPTYDDWPYSVFTMVHGRSRARLRSDHRRDPHRDRRRRVLLALVDQGVQEGARPLLHSRMGRVASGQPGLARSCRTSRTTTAAAAA